jgi:hypothetical protein
LDILQFYAYAKVGQFMGEAELARLNEYGMNQNQRNELRTLLNGLLNRIYILNGLFEFRLRTITFLLEIENYMKTKISNNR